MADPRPPDNSLQLDGEPLARFRLLGRVAARLAEAAPTAEQPPLLLSGDQEASRGLGISLLADLKALGLQRVSFQVSDTPQP